MNRFLHTLSGVLAALSSTTLVVGVVLIGCSVLAESPDGIGPINSECTYTNCPLNVSGSGCESGSYCEESEECYCQYERSCENDNGPPGPCCTCEIVEDA
jgi:hypothetical protein